MVILNFVWRNSVSARKLESVCFEEIKLSASQLNGTLGESTVMSGIICMGYFHIECMVNLRYIYMGHATLLISVAAVDVSGIQFLVKSLLASTLVDLNLVLGPYR